MRVIDLADFADGGMIREGSFRARVAEIDLGEFRGEEVFIKGCAEMPIPTWAFMMIVAHVAQAAGSITFGEEARPMTLFEREALPA
jgi:hypothetical protein